MPKGIPSRTRRIRAMLLGTWLLGMAGGFLSPDLAAQAGGAAIQGTVTDSSGAVIPGAAITVTNNETNLQRTVTSNSAGLYSLPNLPPGRYRVQVSMAGFQTNVRENFALVVGQQLVLNTALEVGEITQQVTVTGEAPLVNTSTAQVSGLVAEREVKDLPLNGRSFDNLITLNPGAVNATALKGKGANGAMGAGQSFAVAGRRPGENVFLWNGVEFPGGGGADNGTPGGVSGQLLGIDAVREFNVMSNIDSVEYGHRAGAQISVVTASGTNSFHGSMFEFLRNSKLDARNFFDRGSIPPFKRNQFGGSAGGPIQKDKTFIFGNYEGFRQRLGLSSVAIVPDAQARRGLLPNAQGVYQPVAGYNPAVAPYFDLWPEPNGPQLLVNGQPTGTALSYNNPPSPIREDFGIVRADRTFSERDSLSASYTRDDGEVVTPGANPFSLILNSTAVQVLSLTETHIVSPNFVNTFTVGYSRPTLTSLLPVTVQPPGTQSFVAGLRMGQIRIGGGQGVGAGALTIAGSGPNTGSQQYENVHTFTYEDQVHISRGIHSITAGGWVERLRWDELSAAFGQAVFPDLASFLQGRPSTMQVQPNLANNAWRIWEGAWYAQDALKLRPNLTLSLGVRHEFTDGFHNKYGNAANFIPGPNGVLLTQPRIADGLFTKNNARWLLGPRAGLAWDPFGDGKMGVRAGFGIAHNLLDNIGWCCRTSHPDFTTYLLTNPPFPLQINPATGFPPGLNVVPGGSGGGGGVQADPQTPTVINYRLEIEREVSPGMSLRVAYIGSHGYHYVLRSDSNTAVPTLCSAAQGNCPAGLSEGTKYYPAGAPRRNPALGSTAQMYTSAVNSYNGLAVDWNRRFRGGLAFRANYTFAKSMDNASNIVTTQLQNNASVVMDNYDRGRDYGLSAFDVRNRFSFSSSYELPFGRGKAFLSGTKGAADKLLSGWQWNVIVGLQSGFPFTPLLGFNRSRNGDTSAPDRPDMAPGRTLSGIYRRTPNQWFDPTAFTLPVAGTYGNAGRTILTGPGLATFDLSLFKTTRLSERSNLQFRAEFFNLLNRANFSFPSLIVLTTTGAPASAAGLISATSTDSRQIQFGLKLSW